MSAKLLSSLVQTKSIELVLAPIAAQVSELIILNEASERDGVALPDLVPSAQYISEAIENLVASAHKLLIETADEDLKSEMPAACDQLTAAKKSLSAVAQQLKGEPFSHKVRYDLVDSARNILEGTMKILIVYDEAEVRKIMCTARWVMDRVGLVEAVTSMRGLVVSFKGFTESLMLLGSLCDKRQRELSNPSLRDRLLSAMTILKKSIQLLSSSMQTWLKNPGNSQAKANRDYVVGQIMLACSDIIKTVQSREGAGGAVADPGFMAATINKAQHQLSPHSRLGMSTELDCCLDAIVRSSMAVAESSEGLRREKIVQQCQKVLQTRNELSESQKALTANPLSSRTKRRLDTTAESLSSELKSLDRLVTCAVVDQISSRFADPELPLHNLVTAATAPVLENSVAALEEAVTEFNDKAEEFKREAASLVQVSRHAAALSADRRRVGTVNGILTDIELLASKLLSTALTVRQSPQSGGAAQRLGILRKHWSAKVDALTDVIDDITDVVLFVDASERQVQEDIARCKDCLARHDVKKLSQASLRLLGRARRLIVVIKREMGITADPRYKGQLQSASGQLLSALPSLARSAEEVLTSMWDGTRHEQFMEHAHLIGEKVKSIKSAIKRPTNPALDYMGAGSDVSETASFGLSENIDDLMAFLDETGSDDVSVGEGSLPDDMGTVSITSSLSDQELSGLLESRKSPVEPQIKSPPSPREAKPERSPLRRSSSDLLSSLLEDDPELDLVDRRALLGLGRLLSETPLSSHTGHAQKPSRTSHASVSRTSRAPVSRLVKAARGRDSREIEARVRDILDMTDTLKGLSEGSAEKSRNMEGVRLVLVTSGEIEKLTPLIVEAARDVSANPRDQVAVERLQTIGREWATKVHVLSAAVDELVMPWSAAASKLALAATSGDAAELKKQVDQINKHVIRLRHLAASTKAAADAEDYAMDAGSEGDAPARDPASLQRIELVRVTSEEIEQITPELTSSARAVVRNPTDITNVERLEQLRRDWASKVNSLVFAVDDVTVGTSAPVEQLASAAMAGDHHAVQERSRMLASYSRMLKEMASAATAGCRNPKKVSVVESTVSNVERLTADLQDTARVVTDMALRGNRTVDQSLAYMSAVEKMGLLQREWAAKAHLLTALVDDLTAEASAPVDRLAGAALAVSKAELSDRPQHESHFEMQAQELAARVARVTTHASQAVEQSRVASKVRNVRVTGDFIDRLTPQVIAAARALADNPDQPTVEHFQMLRRQWASKAQLLMATLDGLPDADHSAVQNVFQDLLDGPQLEPGASFESLNEYEVAAIAGSSRHHSPGARDSDSSPSPTRRRPTSSRTGSPDRDSTGKFADRSFSDTDELPEVRRLRGPDGSASDTDLLRKALVNELNERFSSSESLDGSGSSRRSWAEFDHHRRAWSIAALSRPHSSVGSASTEELRTRKNSKSIAMAARILQDETDQWEEENNSIVRAAKQMAQQMLQMAQFARGRGELQNKTEMIHTAKAIADNGQVIWNFAKIIAEQCVDERCSKDLVYYAEYIPTISQQLKIISAVKAATPMDYSADATLVKNAANLMQAVVKTLHAAEAGCVKGLKPPAQGTTADQQAAAQLAFQWKRTLKRQRAIEALTAPLGSLGLRRSEKSAASPSLVDIVHVGI